MINFNFSSKYNDKLINKKYFGKVASCDIVLNEESDINSNYFEISLRNLTSKTLKTKYYPNCVCLKDMSGFKCDTLDENKMPPKFKGLTHEILLNISSNISEANYYLYTTDIYRLKRYGGLSFDNENIQSNQCNQADTSSSLLTNKEKIKIKINMKKLSIPRKARVWY